MKKFTLLFTLVFSLSFIYTQAQNSADIYVDDPTAPVNVVPGESLPLTPSPGSVLLFDNGPLVNSAGTGDGGADESILQSTSLSMNLLGFGHQFLNDNWIADDFTISDPSGWDITNFVFYAYQTGSTTTSTMTGIHFLIYDGVPGDPGTSVVWGDVSTDRLSSTNWTDIYRATETTSGSTLRPIMENTCDVSFHLDAGTYWVVWQTDGSLGSGPWAPPITLTGETTTGNGMQTLAGLSSWGSALDSGTNTVQGFPFVIYGSPPIPVSNWALGIGLLLISGFIVIRFRKKIMA